VQAVLREKRPRVAKRQRYCWRPTSKEELLKFFAARFVDGLMKFVKHKISLALFEDLRNRLIGANRYDVLHSALAVELEDVSDMASSITTILRGFISYGSVFCVDETIFAHYGAVAESQGLLSYIPGKPYKYGMLSYVLAQQFQYTNLPFAAGILPTFTHARPTPLAASLQLLRSVDALSPDPTSPRTVVLADSLWAFPSYWSEFTRNGVMYVTPVRADCTAPPPQLLQLASKGLKRTFARTFASATRANVVQVIGASSKVATLITSAFTVGNQSPPPPPHKFTYPVAKKMLTMTPEQLFAAFELDPDEVGAFPACASSRRRCPAEHTHSIACSSLPLVGEQNKSANYPSRHRLGCDEASCSATCRRDSDLRRCEKDVETTASASTPRRDEFEITS